LATYQTAGNICVHREIRPSAYQSGDCALASELDNRRGLLLSSRFEFPGRYTRWDIGFLDPPLVITTKVRAVALEARNERGPVLLRAAASALTGLPAIEALQIEEHRISGQTREPGEHFPEEMRSRQPSVFSILRTMADLFGSPEDP